MKHPSASAGNSPRCGARKAGGFQESGLGPATAQSAGAVATSSGNAGRRVTSSPPYTTAGPLGSDPYSQLTSRPEAGRRKPRLSRPAHRPASAPSGPEEVEGPVSGCAIAERVPGPGLRGLAGAGRTGEGGARLPGERQVRPRRASGGEPETVACCRDEGASEGGVGGLSFQEAIRIPAGPLPQMSAGRQLPALLEPDR